MILEKTARMRGAVTGGEEPSSTQKAFPHPREFTLDSSSCTCVTRIARAQTVLSSLQACIPTTILSASSPAP